MPKIGDFDKFGSGKSGFNCIAILWSMQNINLGRYHTCSLCSCACYISLFKECAKMEHSLWHPVSDRSWGKCMREKLVPWHSLQEPSAVPRQRTREISQWQHGAHSACPNPENQLIIQNSIYCENTGGFAIWKT